MSDTPAKPSVEIEITDAMHRHLAIQLFNATWDLLEKSNRTPQEDTEMIDRAHASAYHWSLVGTPAHFTVSAWQIAHVYTLLQHTQEALFHARRSLKTCVANGLGEWRLAFAYEAMARAYAASGEAQQATHYRTLATETGDTIAEEEERNHFFSELAKGPWFNTD